MRLTCMGVEVTPWRDHLNLSDRVAELERVIGLEASDLSQLRKENERLKGLEELRHAQLQDFELEVNRLIGVVEGLEDDLDTAKSWNRDVLEQEISDLKEDLARERNNLKELAIQRDGYGEKLERVRKAALNSSMSAERALWEIVWLTDG